VSDKSPLERVLDVVLFAPTGLAISLGEEFPKMVDKGRHRVEGQVHTARLVGQFAVQFGRQKVEEWTGNAATTAQSAATKASSVRTRGMSATEDSAAAAHDADDAVAPAPPGADEPPARGAAATNGYQPGTHLAIPGYDSLSASQVVQRLDGLSGAELEEVRAHELATRRRRTILSRVEQLLAAAPPGQA
jgi:hypothetical protein